MRPKIQYALWSLVLLRLLLPVSIGHSFLSVENLQESLILPEPAIEQEVFTIRQASRAEPIPQIQQSEIQKEETQKPQRSVAEVVTAVFAGIWITGGTALGLVFVGTNLSFRRRLMESRHQLALPGCKLPVYVTNQIESPCLFGLFHPAVYVTEEVAEEETLFRHTVAHELTHYQHRDEIWTFLRGICLVIHWYNPLVWWAAILSQRDAEMACDERTIQVLGEEERKEYGRTLIHVSCQKNSHLLTAATTMTSDKKVLKERITMITRKPKTIWTALIAAVILSAVFVGCTFTGADQSEKQSAPADSETGTAAVSVNESSAIVPEKNMWMYDLLFADGFYQKDVTATGCAICKDGVQVGGIQNITLSEETLADPVLGEGVAEVLKNDVMPKIAEGDFDYMISGSNRGILAEASFANREKEYNHYVFQNLSGCYDLWVDGSMVDFQLESKILEAVLNPGKVPNELLALKLNLTVPEGMRLFDSKDNSCEILKSISDRAGGICALQLSPDALSNPSSEDVKNAVTSMQDVMRLEMNAYEAVKGTSVPVEITTKDDYYTYHHYIFNIDSDVYDLWLVMENTTEQERNVILDTVLK